MWLCRTICEDGFSEAQLVYIQHFKACLLQTMSARYRLLIRCNPEAGRITAQGKMFRLRGVLQHLEETIATICVRECIVGISAASFMPAGWYNPEIAARLATFLAKVIQVSWGA